MLKKISLMMLLAGAVTLGACNKTDNTTAEPQSQSNNPSNTNDPNNNDPNNTGGGNNGSLTPLTYSKKTNAVMFEITSTGCPGCGSWGKPTFASLISSNMNNVVPIAVHIKYGDPMITAESQAIGDNRYGQRYTPQIWVGDENAVVLTGGGIDGSASIQKANELIATDATTEQPALAADVKKDGSKINVTYGVKFIDVVADGEYGLSCYLMENGIVYQQTSYAANPATHNHVIRTSAAGAFGESFTSADLTDNEKSWAHTFDISSYNADNVYIAVVLWKKDGTRYQVVNATTIN